ncbi:Ppx/GppA phosphatase family protein [Leptospira sp. GIMC2001]|uniref:Ppx/GppA phosphatase family protein n=1 Tax=Leptospira sp. GIMC2001 TaxID=1513297 RepID=UPI0023494789|nr:Ppx/GppA phosphatase family protein [Leptospira sp. GIMC2001]WCL50166.1 Ppx/GppA phosphatase family protein [Leptospira sp. GIMC2001]
MKEKNLAAIDLGTNSFHMLIVKVRSDGTTEPIAKEKESVRLGSGSGEYDEIHQDAMDRGIACLKRFKTLADSHKAEIHAIATSALREALNRDIFLNKAKKETGIKIEVVNGLEEARLIYFGILQGLPVFQKRILMIDIGGGSTELLIGEAGDVLFSQSLKLGAVRLTERFFRKDNIEITDVQKCRFHIESVLLPLIPIINKLKPEIIIGSSGSVTSIGSMILAKRGEKRDRLNGYEFTSQELKSVREELNAANTLKKRMKIPGLEEKRGDIIIGGSLVLEEIFNQFNLKKLMISDYALREGIIYDIIKNWKRYEKSNLHGLDNIRAKAIRSIANLYPQGKDHAEQVTHLSLRLYDELSSLHGYGVHEKEFLEAAASLHQIGLAISHSAYHKHSYYIIRNSEQMVGFSNAEIELIALIARYHRKSMPKPKHEEFKVLSGEEQNLVRRLAAILKIADAMNRSQKKIISDLEISIQDKIVVLSLKTLKKSDPHLELYAIEENKDLFEDAYGKTLKVLIGENSKQ